MTEVKCYSIKFLCCVLALAIVVVALLFPRPDLVAAQGSPSGPAASATASTLTGGSPAAAATPASSGEISAATSVDRDTVTSYLARVITWYRHLAVEESIAQDPAEMLFLADDREVAGEVFKLAFEYARAEASLLKIIGGEGGDSPPAAARGTQVAISAPTSPQLGAAKLWC